MNKMADKKAKAGGMSKVGDGDSSGSRKSTPNQMPGFTGNLYQSKWLMWYLLKGLSSQYKFELGTEEEAAGKYDDLVFKYKKVVDGNEKDHFIIMQTKHKTNVDKKITYQDVFTYGNVDFGFVKYFTSFAESKTAEMFKDGEIEHAIIYTNACFDMSGKIPVKDQNWNELKNFGNITEEMKLKEDDTLSAFKIKGGKFYQFKSDLVLPVLKSMVLDYEYYKIAQKLIECLKDKNKYFSLNDKILKHYNHLLLTEVIDRKSRMFFKDFLNENCDDVKNDTGRKKLRRALDKVLHDEKLKIEEIAKNTFKWRKDFENSEPKTQNWPAYIDDAYLKEFLKKSVFATGQPDERLLGKAIFNSLRKQFSTYDTDFIYSFFCAEIQKWMISECFCVDKFKNISESKFISYDDVNKFFERTIDKFNKIVLKGPIVDYDRHIQEYKIEFVDLEYNSTIKTFLDSDQRILSIISKHTMISSIKLYTKLKKTDELKQFIYIKLSLSNNNLLNSVIKTFDSELDDRLLVIEWDCDETRLDDWSNKINDLIDSIRSLEKKLIIISNRNDILEKYFQNDFSINTELVEIKDDANTLVNLEKDSQDCVLDAVVKFQGKDARLRDFIVDDNLKKAVDGDILQKILKREDINIDTKIEGLRADMQDYYIDRKFMHKVEDDTNVFLVSGINEAELDSEYQNFEIIEKKNFSTGTEIHKFKRIVEENKSKNVYLLRQRSDKLILLEKSKKLFRKSDFINAIQCRHNKCEINLISAVAGTGKSTFFTKLSQKIKDENPELWVAQIDLNAVSSKLREIKNNQDIQFETVIDFLHHGTKLHNELEKTIFKHRLKSGNVELLLDGFDEICPSYKSIVLAMIQKLGNEATIKTIWLSTRPYDSILNDMKKNFVNFHVKHYDFEPLTESSQKKYLKNFWRQSIRVDEKFFMLFFKELFELFNNNMKGEFLGVPLHMMLIGITFKDIFGEFQNISKRKINTQQRQMLLEMANLSSLYDKFVKFKHEIRYKDKINLSSDIQAGKNILSESYKSCLKKSKILALDSLFDKKELKVLLTETKLKELKKYKKEIEELKDPFGIVNRIVNEKPQFIHRTFAEYFAAMFFVEKLKIGETKSQKIIEYFLENMINDENSMICDFINSKLNSELKSIEYTEKYVNVVKKMDGEIFLFVLVRKWQNIGEILIKNGILETVDNFINLLVEGNNYDDDCFACLLNLLKSDPDKMKSLFTKKNNDGHTLFDTAVAYGQQKKFEAMWNLCDELNITTDSVLSNETIKAENILHLAARYRCDDACFIHLLNLFKSDPDKMKSLLTKKNNDGYTPFDMAVSHGQQKKFETMWNLCDELNITTDSVLFNETIKGENILHLAAVYFCGVDCFTYLSNLLISDQDKLKELLTKKDNDGYTPFDTAVSCGGREKIEAIWNLCDKLNISSVLFNETAKGENIIHLVAKCRCDEACFIYVLNLLKSNPRKLKELLTKKNNDGHTPVDIATVYKQNHKLEILSRILVTLKKVSIQ